MAASFNELQGLGSHSDNANLKARYLLDDDAANTTVVDSSATENDGTLAGGDNTEDKSATGPNSWLTKAFTFNGTDDYVNLGTGSRSILTGASGYTLLLRAKYTSTSRMVPFGCYDGNAVDNPAFTLDLNRSSSIPTTNGIFSFNRRTASSGTSDTNGYTTHSGLTDGNWHNISVAVNTSSNTIAIRVDKTAKTTTYVSQLYSGTIPNLLKNFYIGALNNDGSPGTYFTGTLSDLQLLTDVLSSTDVDQWEDGPELIYSTGASLGDDGAYSVGTWVLPSPFGSGSNGTPMYEWVIANAAGSVVDSGSVSSGTADISSEEGNTVYLLVRASNTGGYDVGDKATRTSGYGSSGDGYYEVDSVVAAGGGGGFQPAWAANATQVAGIAV